MASDNAGHSESIGRETDLSSILANSNDKERRRNEPVLGRPSLINSGAVLSGVKPKPVGGFAGLDTACALRALLPSDGRPILLGRGVVFFDEAAEENAGHPKPGWEEAALSTRVGQQPIASNQQPLDDTLLQKNLSVSLDSFCEAQKSRGRIVLSMRPVRTRSDRLVVSQTE